MVDDKDLSRKVVSDKTLLSLGKLTDLPSHAILDRGRLIGLWEFDVHTQSIVCALFSRTRDNALAGVIGDTESYVRDELGDARSFSLDSPKSRQPRIEALRRMEEQAHVSGQHGAPRMRWPRAPGLNTASCEDRRPRAQS